jgi:hypothetical protein
VIREVARHRFQFTSDNIIDHLPAVQFVDSLQPFQEGQESAGAMLEPWYDVSFFSISMASHRDESDSLF